MIPSTLRDFRASGAPVLSLYLNRDGLPSAPRMHELLKAALTRVPELSRDHSMALRGDVAAVEAAAEKVDRTTSPSVALFASSTDGLFELVELPEQVWDTAVVATDLYLRPLRAVREERPIGVVVVDRAKAWVFTQLHGEIEKIAELDDRPSHPKNPDEGLKRNYGGWHGYAERRARAHATALTQRHFQDAARLLSDLDGDHGFAAIVIGGHSQTLDEFVDFLHPSLRGKLAGTFRADPRTLDRAQVRDLAIELVGSARQEAELGKVDALLQEAGGGSRGVLGLKGVLFAANLHAIDHLLVAGSFTKPGHRCEECGWLSRNGPACVACDGRTVAVEDIVASVIERSVAEGATVDHLKVASQLDAAGVGARLRFPIPDAL